MAIPQNIRKSAATTASNLAGRNPLATKPGLNNTNQVVKPAVPALAAAAKQVGGVSSGPSPAEKKVADAEAALATAEKRLDSASSGSSIRAIEHAAAAVREAKDDLKEAKLELEVEKANERLDAIRAAGTGGLPNIEGAIGQAIQDVARAEGALQDYRIERVIKKSPSLKADIARLEAEGWTIQTGAAGGGSYANHGTKTITIDGNHVSNPARYVQSLSHEVGHAVYGAAPFTPIGDLSRQKFIDANSSARATGEGYATLYNAKVRDEISANGGPAVNVSGAQSADYIAIYEQVKAGTLTEAEAAERIGELFLTGETGSRSGQSYADNYADFYGDFYDNNS